VRSPSRSCSEIGATDLENLLRKFIKKIMEIAKGYRAQLAAQRTLVIAVSPATIDIGMGKSYPDPKVSPEEVIKDVSYKL
jgi:hypothetical protein